MKGYLENQVVAETERDQEGHLVAHSRILWCLVSPWKATGGFCAGDYDYLAYALASNEAAAGGAHCSFLSTTVRMISR